MTNREFYTAVANQNITEEVVAHAVASLEKLDATNEKRKNKPSKTAIENAPVIEAITGVLTNDPQTAADIAVAVGITTQKALTPPSGISEYTRDYLWPPISWNRP